MSNGSEAPNCHRYSERPSRTELIYQVTGAQQSDGIGRLKDASDEAELKAIPSNGDLKSLGKHAQHLPVEQVDGGSKKEQRADGPSDLRSARRRCGRGV